MTSCNEFQNRWSEWDAGALDHSESQLLWLHARECSQCAAYHRQMQSMVRALNSLPAPGPIPEGLTERVLANAPAADGEHRHARRRTAHGLGIAASILVLVLGAALLRPTGTAPTDVSESNKPTVVLSLDRTRNVHVVFDARQSVKNVEYTIELPDGVEVVGYPGLEVLRWTGELQAGRNGLTLPLVSRRAGENGTLKARIRYEQAERELTVPLQTRKAFNSDDNASTQMPVQPGPGTVYARRGEGVAI